MESCGKGGTTAWAIDQRRFVMYKLWRPRPRRAVPDRTDVAAFSDVHARPTRGSGLGARDPGALHLADAGPVVLDGVVLGAAVVPDGEAVLRPPPADLVLRDGGLADQVVEEFAP